MGGITYHLKSITRFNSHAEFYDCIHSLLQFVGQSLKIDITRCLIRKFVKTLRSGGTKCSLVLPGLRCFHRDFSDPSPSANLVGR